MSVEEKILHFWFGALDSNGVATKENVQKWFKKSEATDDFIRIEFGDDVEKALDGQYDKWADAATGTLALILLLDQFPRNIYRGTSKAFAGDQKAQTLVLNATEKRYDKELPYSHRWFLYMPLMHSEDLGLQALSYKKFQELHDEVPEELKDRFGTSYAKSHADIIKQFGRFPHRNESLARKSTAQEIEFLKQPNSGF